ncbi:MAG: hypothetical protein H7X93_05445 [Sphingomonadaceae bacterium]|nr:hypothetical protein [Sphingomonadaceae bacterium]
MKTTSAVASVVTEPDEIDLTQEQIGILRERGERSRELVGDLAFSLAKWMIASLLALNAGGAIAVLNIDRLERTMSLVSGLAFVLGMTCALLCAFVLMSLAIRRIPDQSALLQLKPGVYKICDINRISMGEEVPVGIRDPVLWLGWFAFLFFLVGAAVAGWAIPAKAQTIAAESTGE